MVARITLKVRDFIPTKPDMLKRTKLKPMPHLLIHHKVENFAIWKRAYDGHRNARDQAGLTELHLLRTVADQNDVVILFETDDLERARAFVRSDDLRNKMQEAGVIGTPELLELE
jgi:heme-degrading monooxygenase HmoA